ncbi:MAG: WD40 repeat domain-containing protein, partial [Odoribacter splanchnicus]|nr:WD40 repeat domain-containing protein [Odoribacter splanchnicus]
MKKGLLLSFLAIVFVGAVVFGIWYINESGKMRSGSKDSFIPNNSALIIQFNSNARLSGVLQTAFADDIRDFRKSLLARVADTLIRQGYVDSLSRIMAMRVEGKRNVALLYVMDNRIVLSRNEMADFLKQAFQGGEKVRKYDSHKIYTIKQGKEEVYFSVCGGIVLFSDSDLYIEDGLKQFDQEEDESTTKPRYQNLSKYFSAGAGVNILLNTEAFSDLLPLVVRSGKINPVLDVTKCFKWGAFDGEFSEHGICLNGFMSYAGLSQSYMQTLEKQQPKDVRIDGVIPAGAVSFGMLNLSNIPAYFSALEAYRYNVGLKEKVFGRKQQL